MSEPKYSTFRPLSNMLNLTRKVVFGLYKRAASNVHCWRLSIIGNTRTKQPEIYNFNSNRTTKSKRLSIEGNLPEPPDFTLLYSAEVKNLGLFTAAVSRRRATS